jgi:translation elongation factor EF-G
MDSGELEIERGITITSKVTRFAYKRPDYRLCVGPGTPILQW